MADLVREVKEFGPQVRARVMQLLEEARKQVIGSISNVDPNGYQASQLRSLSKQIDAALEKFRGELTSTVQDTQKKAFQQGELGINQALDAGGISVPTFAGISESALGIVQGYTADLIGGLTKKAAADLNGAIQRAFLGGQSLQDIVNQVGRAIGGDKFTGLFSPVAARAESIATNEILRVHSMASQARLSALESSVPSLQKQWLHVPLAIAPRIAHIAANGQVRDVNQPFDVGGEKLMYPRDPNGSADNTINCHCLLVPYVASDLLKPTNEQKQILKDAGISVSAG